MENSPVLLKFCMKMRWIIVIKEHSDNDTEEAADFRHDIVCKLLNQRYEESR